MKWKLAAVIAVSVFAGAIWYQHRPAAPPAAAPETVPGPAEPVAVAAATPVPAPERRLAPDGTYFLIRRISVTTSDGVVGIAPGTKLTRVASNGPMMTVKDGAQQFDVPSADLTNDLDQAYLVAAQNQSERAIINAVNAAQRKQLQLQAQADAIQQAQAAKEEAKRISAPQSQSVPGTGSDLQMSGDLGRKAYDQRSNFDRARN